MKEIGLKIANTGIWIILIWIGIFKFTETEANAILPLIKNSPLLSWQLKIFSIQTISNIIGTIEIITALLMISNFKYKILGQIGYAFGSVMFLVTITFLFSTPEMFKVVDGLLIANGFLLKDICLLGICLANINLKEKPWNFK